VACFDDDIVLEPGSINEMIKLWNRSEQNAAGVSFNIVNVPGEKYSKLKEVFGLSSAMPGRVLKSGTTTSNCNVTSDIRVQWLCGGATVWRKEILDSFLHKDVSSRWAIAEDLVFSYPIGKKYPLFVCSAARVRHEHVFDYNISTRRELFHGRVQTLWLLYFVISNRELSINIFYWTLFVRILGKFIKGIALRNSQDIWFAIGQIEGSIQGIKALLAGRNIADVISELT
jgi:GT2 family glycosyltransferase